MLYAFRKIDIDAKKGEDTTALHQAAARGHSTAVKLLLKAKADVNVNSYSGTALHMAAMNGHEAVVKLLLEAKADVNVKSNDGSTPLHWGMPLYWVAKKRSEAVVKLLLEAKADVNAEDNDGWTALDWAPGTGMGQWLSCCKLGIHGYCD